MYEQKVRRTSNPTEARDTTLELAYVDGDANEQIDGVAFSCGDAESMYLWIQSSNATSTPASAVTIQVGLTETGSFFDHPDSNATFTVATNTTTIGTPVRVITPWARIEIDGTGAGATWTLDIDRAAVQLLG